MFLIITQTDNVSNQYMLSLLAWACIVSLHYAIHVHLPMNYCSLKNDMICMAAMYCTIKRWMGALRWVVY